MGIVKLVLGSIGFQMPEIGVIGHWIVDLIFIVSIIHIIANLSIASKYKTLKSMTIKGKESNEFKNKSLKNIYETFKKSAENGTENINTDVIIEKNMPSIYLIEQFLKYGLTVVVILGLLGTFIGLTQAITGMSQDVFPALDKNNFSVSSLEPSLQAMGTAFITSIAGIVASILLNTSSIIFYKSCKIKFYDEMEHYLDNEVYCRFSKSFANQFNDMRNKFENSMENMTVRVEAAMISMTENVSGIFKQGIGELTNKINAVGVDLTKSSDSLGITIDKLEKNVARFGEPVGKFKESVDKFSVYYEGMNLQINRIDEIANKAIGNMGKSVQVLKDNNEEIIKVSKSLESSSLKTETAYTGLTGAIEEVHNYMKQIAQVNKGNEGTMTHIFEKLISAVELLEKETKLMANNVAQEFKKSIEEGINEISESVSGSIGVSIKEIQKETEHVRLNLDIFGKTINSQSKWIQEDKKGSNYEEIVVEKKEESM